MKKFYFLLLATLTMCIYSCTQEEPVFEHCSEQISLNETEIENLYCLYSTDAVKDFSEKFKNLLPIKPETIFVGGNGYYGDCEHQFVMDMAKA